MLLLLIRGRGVGFEKRTLQTAVAILVVICFSDMPTMWAEPEGERCVSFGSGVWEAAEMAVEVETEGEGLEKE